MSYECHITTTTKYAAQVDKAVICFKGWKKSNIDGDPVLGDGVHMYLTAHDTSFDSLFDRMVSVTAFLIANEAEVVREKIEHIVYDSRQKGEVIRRRDHPRLDERLAAYAAWKQNTAKEGA